MTNNAMSEDQYFRSNFMQPWQREPRTAGHPPAGTPARSGASPAAHAAECNELGRAQSLRTLGLTEEDLA